LGSGSGSGWDSAAEEVDVATATTASASVAFCLDEDERAFAQLQRALVYKGLVYNGLVVQNCDDVFLLLGEGCDNGIDDEAYSLVHSLCPKKCDSCTLWKQPGTTEDEAEGVTTIFGTGLPYLDYSSLVQASNNVPFYPVLDHEFGVCYQFRPEKALLVETVGAYAPHRLEMRTFVDSGDYLPTSEFEGTVITIHGKDDLAKAGGRTVFVPPGFSAAVGVRQVEVERLPSPYSNCKEGGRTKELCEFESTFVYLVEQCGCRDIYRSDYVLNDEFKSLDTPVCSTDKDWQCIFLKAEYARANLEEISKGQCVEPPCSESKFDVSLLGLLPIATRYRAYREDVMRSERASLGGAAASNAGLPPLAIVNESSRVSIFFDDLKIVKYEDQAVFDFISLVAGIGGFFGLFLGMSLFTFMEMAEYLVVKSLGLNEKLQMQ
jgi:hypothetical protein